MSIKTIIRRTVDGGAYTYGIVESYVLGLATVRLAEGGARLTGIPVTSNVRAGDVVIVDYTSDVPSVRRNTGPARGRRVRPLPVARIIPRSENITSTRVSEP